MTYGITPTMLSLLEAPQAVLQSDLSFTGATACRGCLGLRILSVLNPAISNSIFIPPSLSSFFCMELHLLFTINVPYIYNYWCSSRLYWCCCSCPIRWEVSNFHPKANAKANIQFSKPLDDYVVLIKVRCDQCEHKSCKYNGQAQLGYAVSSTKASSSGSTRHDNINSNDSRGRAMESDNGNNDAAVRSWWRSPGEWGPG